MARRVIVECDNPAGKPGGCARPAAEWVIQREGDKTQKRVGLCDVHAKYLLVLWDRGEPVTPDIKPTRRSMTVTELKTTPATERLKRRSQGPS